MKLALRSWGSGPRTALLVHGYTDDALTWWRVGPALAGLGWTVLAPDLRGHGDSPRVDSYRIEDFAADLLDTLPTGADLALGHSLGAVALGLAAPQLGARRTVFADPAWFRAEVGESLRHAPPLTADALPAAASGWAPEDVAVDLASNARLDPRVGPALAGALRPGAFAAPTAPEPGSVVLVPAIDPVLPVQAHAVVVSLGYTLVTQPGVRHVMHRDDPSGFLALLVEELLEVRRVA